jgi:hypothetical protein
LEPEPSSPAESVETLARFFTHSPAPPALALDPGVTSEEEMRAVSVVGYRMAQQPAADGQAAGLQRAVVGLTMQNRFMGLVRQTNAQGEELDSDFFPPLALEQVRAADDSRDLLQALEGHYETISPAVLQISLSYQTAWSWTAPNGAEVAPGTLLNQPPTRELPPGSGHRVPDIRRIGAIYVTVVVTDPRLVENSALFTPEIREALASHFAPPDGILAERSGLEEWLARLDALRRDGQTADDNEIPKPVLDSLQIHERAFLIGH